MKLYSQLILLLLLLSVFSSKAQEDKNTQYILNYAAYAIEEMELYKIPASITLGQGILETANGQSELAQNANNHFGIKCKREWKGKTYRYTDDAYKECFRKYNNVRESYRDHSQFLAERPYYKKLFSLGLRDYKAWSYGLKNAGYATNPKYANILIGIIEKYNLDRFDYVSLAQVDEKLEEWYGTKPKEELASSTPKDIKPLSPTVEYEIPVPHQENFEHYLSRKKQHPTGNSFVIAKPGESIADIVRLFRISRKKLLKFNDLNENSDLFPGQPVFFKNKKNAGSQAIYEVQSGDSLYLISQKMGVKLKKLRKRNRLNSNYTPKPGEILFLRGRKKR